VFHELLQWGPKIWKMNLTIFSGHRPLLMEKIHLLWQKYTYNLKNQLKFTNHALSREAAVEAGAEVEAGGLSP